MAPLPTRETFASLLNHTLLDPTFSNAQVIAGLELARQNHVALATVRPCDADLAVRTLEGAATRAAVIAGYPFGFQNTGVKLYEARDLLRRGIREIGVVMAVAQLASREFQHIQTELNQMTEACRAESARLTVYLDTPALTTELKIIACTCIERAEVDAVAVPDASDLEIGRAHV